MSTLGKVINTKEVREIMSLGDRKGMVLIVSFQINNNQLTNTLKIEEIIGTKITIHKIQIILQGNIDKSLIQIFMVMEIKIVRGVRTSYFLEKSGLKGLIIVSSFIFISCLSIILFSLRVRQCSCNHKESSKVNLVRRHRELVQRS